MSTTASYTSSPSLTSSLLATSRNRYHIPYYYVRRYYIPYYYVRRYYIPYYYVRRCYARYHYARRYYIRVQYGSRTGSLTELLTPTHTHIGHSNNYRVLLKI